jgi:hypothetical protein
VNTIIQQQRDNSLNAICTYFIASTIVIASIVIADQNIPLDLDLHLDSASAKNILTRKDWRKSKTNDGNWRKKSVIKDTHDWNAGSVYENDRQLPPILTDDIKPSGVLDSRQASPTLKLRF